MYDEEEYITNTDAIACLSVVNSSSKRRALLNRIEFNSQSIWWGKACVYMKEKIIFRLIWSSLCVKDFYKYKVDNLILRSTYVQQNSEAVLNEGKQQ